MSKTTRTKTNYIEHGSERHLEILGLRKATDDDEIQAEGYTFVDITAYPANARPDYLKNVIRQLLSEWKSKHVKPQSDDPFEKNYAPPIFDPYPGEKRRDIPDVTAVQQP